MLNISKLIIQTINEKNLKSAIEILREKDLLVKSDLCPLCEEKLENVGGFLPKREKVMLICDKLNCIMKASYLTMKYNGNGSPIIEK